MVLSIFRDSDQDNILSLASGCSNTALIVATISSIAVPFPLYNPVLSFCHCMNISWRWIGYSKALNQNRAKMGHVFMVKQMINKPSTSL